MKKVLTFIMNAFLLLVTAVSCMRDDTLEDIVTLTVSASSPSTKTVLNDGQVNWLIGDHIWIASEDGTVKSSSECDEAGAVFDFSVKEWPGASVPSYAVFCGDCAPELSGSSVLLTLNDSQTISRAESFDDGCNISVGRLERGNGNSYSALLKNVCGLMKFSFSKYDDIVSVTIEDVDGLPMAGTVLLSMNENDEPIVDEVSVPSYSVTLTNVREEVFPMDRSFYACVLPGEYTPHITLTRSNGEKLGLTGGSSVSLDRNGCIVMENIDTYVKEIIDETGHEGYDQQELPLFFARYMDFSRVGYHWGESEPATVAVKTTISSPEDGSDMTEAIQNAINSTTDGAVLLTAGTYNVSGQLALKSGVVLRGEGEGTVIVATGTSRYVDPDAATKTDRSLITIGEKVNRTYSGHSDIIEDAAVGQMWVRVADPSGFAVGDNVAVYRPGTEAWIHDLRMDLIPQNSDNSVIQWNEKSWEYLYSMYWSRRVVKISGERIFLDNPLVMELTAAYGETARGQLCKEICTRVCECGIEDICLKSEFDETEISDGEHVDEDHCWSAITVCAAEHCWVRKVTAQHFGYCMTDLQDGARNITVSDCVCKDPVSKITSSRRYAFHIYKAEQCLVRDCTAYKDRHGCITGVRTPGPNVFRNCRMEDIYSDVGPHQRWATGTLYDCCTTDGLLAIQDRDNWGTGHGWAGANFIFWNCDAGSLVCQSPWVTGKNWCVGCTGARLEASRAYDDGVVRPEGEWISHGQHVTPLSLYENQLRVRLAEGNTLTDKLL